MNTITYSSQRLHEFKKRVLFLGLIRDHTSDVTYFLTVYIAIGVLNSFFVICRAFLFAYGGIRAATRVHKSLLASIVQVNIHAGNYQMCI